MIIELRVLFIGGFLKIWYALINFDRFFAFRFSLIFWELTIIWLITGGNHIDASRLRVICWITNIKNHSFWAASGRPRRAHSCTESIWGWFAPFPRYSRHNTTTTSILAPTWPSCRCCLYPQNTCISRMPRVGVCAQISCYPDSIYFRPPCRPHISTERVYPW